MLLDREIDVAVHSMKDMPTIMTTGLKVAAWLQRGDEREVLISNQNQTLADLTKNSIIGTSSIRRRSQVLNIRTDLCIKLIRGNVDTRIQKFDDGQYDALILGYGGIKRLDLENRISQTFSIDEILPPACQAAIGIQTLDEDSDLINLISKTNNENSSIIGLAERTVLGTLQANCNSPVGVLASIDDEKDFTIKVELFSHNGSEKYFTKAQGKVEDSNKLAKEAGANIIDKVGHEYIKKLDILEDDFNYSP
jgi:hydroxymethylbilane synthase